MVDKIVACLNDYSEWLFWHTRKYIISTVQRNVMRPSVASNENMSVDRFMQG